MGTSTHTDLGAPEALDIRKALWDHEQLHLRLHTADDLLDATEYEAASKAIDQQLEAFGRQLTPEGVIQLFHFACELVSDATSPRTPHDLHLDSLGVERVKQQADFMVSRLSEI